MKVNLEGDNPLTALGVSPERCQELCTAIEDTKAEHGDWKFGAVLNHVYSEHCKNDNEKLFVMYVFGTHQGVFMSRATDKFENAINSLFSHINSRKNYQWREHAMN